MNRAQTIPAEWAQEFARRRRLAPRAKDAPAAPLKVRYIQGGQAIGPEEREHGRRGHLIGPVLRMIADGTVNGFGLTLAQIAAGLDREVGNTSPVVLTYLQQGYLRRAGAYGSYSYTLTEDGRARLAREPGEG